MSSRGWFVFDFAALASWFRASTAFGAERGSCLILQSWSLGLWHRQRLGAEEVDGLRTRAAWV